MKKILVVLALLLASMVPLALTSTSAQAVAGCSGNVIDKADSWAKDAYYTAEGGLPGPAPGVYHVRMTGTVVYQFCPQGTAVNKIMPKNITWCWTHFGDKSVFFDGTKMNANFFDDRYDVNPPEHRIQDEPDSQRCEVQTISLEIRHWLYMSDSPGWTIDGWLVLQNWPDQEQDFKYDGSRIKYFHPSGANVSGWYN